MFQNYIKIYIKNSKLKTMLLIKKFSLMANILKQRKKLSLRANSLNFFAYYIQ